MVGSGDSTGWLQPPIFSWELMRRDQRGREKGLLNPHAASSSPLSRMHVEPTRGGAAKALTVALWRGRHPPHTPGQHTWGPHSTTHVFRMKLALDPQPT